MKLSAFLVIFIAIISLLVFITMTTLFSVITYRNFNRELEKFSSELVNNAFTLQHENSALLFDFIEQWKSEHEVEQEAFYQFVKTLDNNRNVLFLLNFEGENIATVNSLDAIESLDQDDFRQAFEAARINFRNDFQLYREKESGLPVLYHFRILYKPQLVLGYVNIMTDLDIRLEFLQLSERDKLLEIIQIVFLFSIIASSFVMIITLSILNHYISRPLKNLLEEIRNTSFHEVPDFKLNSSVYEISELYSAYKDMLSQLVDDKNQIMNQLKTIQSEHLKREQAETEVSVRDLQYEYLAENIPQFLFIKDTHFKFTYCNSAMARILGIEQDDIIGKDDSEFFSEELAEKYRQDDLYVIDTKEILTFEEEYLRDGETRWLSVTKVPMLDSEGDVIYILGIAWDITTQKKQEETIRVYNVELEKMIEVRTAELEQAKKELEVLSQIDELTKLNNRRIFNEVLDREWNRCKRGGHPLSLIMLDIDFFKRLNDQYGHLEGDSCLSKVAGAITECLHRSSDLAARYGGEEFVALLPENSIEEAMRIAKKMIQAIRDLKIPHAVSEIDDYVTASFGVATIIPEGNDAQILVKLADENLYRAKRQGRNRIVG